MATATQTAPDAYLQSGSSPPTVEEQAILAAYQKTETHGLEFGRLCYDYRAKHSAQGSRTGEGLRQLLRKLGIKEGKAYYWIAAYEEVIGVRAPAPDSAPEELEPESAVHSDWSPASVADILVDDPDDPPALQTAKLKSPAVIELKEGVRVSINGRVFKITSPIKDDNFEQDYELPDDEAGFVLSLHVASIWKEPETVTVQ